MVSPLAMRTAKLKCVITLQKAARANGDRFVNHLALMGNGTPTGSH
jgi:hypothetical protein